MGVQYVWLTKFCSYILDHLTPTDNGGEDGTLSTGAVVAITSIFSLALGILAGVCLERRGVWGWFVLQLMKCGAAGE